MTQPKNGAASARIFPSVDTVPGYRKVAQIIEAEIVEGRLKVGELLPTEGDLAEQLGVHRSTIREGIRAMENAGLVRRAGGKRLIVTVPDSSSLAWVNSRALGLSKVSFRELWELQMEVEPFAAQLAAERATDELVGRLVASIRSVEDRLDDDQAVIAHDIAFHNLVAEASSNKALCLSVAPMGVLLFSATIDLYRKVPQARHRLIEAHRRIARAIASHDASDARLWMEKHIRDFRRGYEVGGMDMEKPISLDADARRALLSGEGVVAVTGDRARSRHEAYGRPVD